MIQIIDKSQCCGCTACVAVCPKQCITMQEDNEGFLYPQIDTSLCIDCNLCKKVCPIHNQSNERKPLTVYAAKNRNEEIRLNSSSGGIFTLLAEKTINEGGVVFGARFDEKWEVMHDYAETKERLAAFRGSKYVQSRMGNCYNQAKLFLDNGRKVLFTGTSCQIAGLKNFLRKDYDNLITVDMVCHGVPSPKAWRLYINDITKGHKSIDSICFRYKSHSWKNFRFIIKENNKTSSNDIINERGFDNKWMHAFLINLMLRPSCHYCPAQKGKSGSDITLGDYWGIERFAANFDDDKGCSLVLINTAKGENIYTKLNCDSLTTPYEYALPKNPSLETPTTASINRNFLLSQLDKGFIAAYDTCTNHSLHMRLRRLLFRKLGI